eukprot:1630379-Ditylum_brightwellii.AAC.1
MAPPEAKKLASQQFNWLYPVTLAPLAAQPQSTRTSMQAMQELLIQQLLMQFQQYKMPNQAPTTAYAS